MYEYKHRYVGQNICGDFWIRGSPMYDTCIIPFVNIAESVLLDLRD